MKIDIQSKKGLTTVLSISVDKKSIQKKMEERLSKVKDQVSLKGFRPGKVPSSVIKSQFGKAIYGEVIDQLLKVIPYFVCKIPYYHILKVETDIYVWAGMFI